MTADRNTASILRECANTLEHGHWNQGTEAINEWGGSVEYNDNKAKSWCAIGILKLKADQPSNLNNSYYEVVEELAKWLLNDAPVIDEDTQDDYISCTADHDVIIGWNDQIEMTDLHVIEQLRACAGAMEDKLEEADLQNQPTP